MFTLFSNNKTNYESGQVFPFLIAIICIVVIMAMVTINLGQLAIYRTDVSNAADAGALAGASVMSGQLLAYGLTSDYMAGSNLAKLAGIVVAFLVLGPAGIVPALAIFVTIGTANIAALMKAYLDSQLAWIRARQTALQYAFNNAGVDEPRPTYEEFLSYVGAGPSEATYNEYLRADTPRARIHARAGFAKFMENQENGWWITSRFGEIENPEAPPGTPLVINGYGWGPRDDSGRIRNSFEEHDPGACADSRCWRTPPEEGGYNHFVEVSVRSRLMYSFQLVNLGALQTALAWAVFAYVFITQLPVLLAFFSFLGPFAFIVAPLLAAAVAMVAKILVESVALGIEFADPKHEYINSPVEVQVARYKIGEDVGLWRFRFGNRFAPIRAVAKGSVYRQIGDEKIGPAFLSGELWPFLLGAIVGGLVGGLILHMIMNWDEIFDTQKHLFEVHLQQVQ